MKIRDLHKINELAVKVELMVNHQINTELYDHFCDKEINFLLENSNEIENDFKDNISKLTFDIIMETDLEERVDLILDIKNVEEFTKYMSIIPFEALSKAGKREMNLAFESFKKMSTNYLKLRFFDQFARK